MMAGIDFEAEGLLGNLTGKAREARLALLNELVDEGVSLEELKRAVEENRLVLLPVERVFDSGTQHYSAQQIAELAGLEQDFLLRRADPRGRSAGLRGRRPRGGQAGQAVPRCRASKGRGPGDLAPDWHLDGEPR
jgi:hypothetical protein